jgi:hypothetical protein
MEPNELKLGEYRHFKGEVCIVIGFAKNSETKEDMVIYETPGNEVSQVWVRPVSMFTEKVIVNGMKIARFKYIGK